MASTLTDEYVNDQLYQGNYHLLENNFMKSYNIFYNLWEEGVKHPGVLHNTGLSLELMGRFKEALKYYMETIKLFPDYFKSFLGVYNCYMYMGDIENGAVYLKRCLSLHSEFPQVNILMSELLFETGVKDYNYDGVTFHQMSLEFIEKNPRTIQTNNYAQCYYESFGETIYYMFDEHSYLSNPIQTRPLYDVPEGDLVVLMMVNHGYASITQNAIESITRNCPEVLPNILLICLDTESYEIFKNYPIHIQVFDSLIEYNSTIGIYNQSYFNRLVTLKVYFTQQVLLLNKMVLFCDGDVVWLRNPLPELLQNSKHEFLAQQEDGEVFCTGFFLVKPSPRMMMYVFDYKKIPPRCGGEQPVINYLCQTTNVPHMILNSETFPNGNVWYNSTKSLDPYIVHYNFIIGFEKIKKMKEYGHWYVSHDSVQDTILEDTFVFRCPPHSNSGYDGPWIENSFYSYWISHRKDFDTTMIYLPIFWTDVCVQYPNIYKTIETFLQTLDTSLQYFTVIQNSNGFDSLTIPENLSLTLFAAGTNNYPSKYTMHTIPLLKKELQFHKGKRNTLVSFAGTVKGFSDYKEIRSKMAALVVDYGWKLYSGNQWEEVMKDSTFSLCPRGWGPTSFRLFEAIQNGSIPIIIWDDTLFLPYPNLDWASFCVIIHANDIETLRDVRHISPEKIKEMQNNMAAVRHMFTYEYVSGYIHTKLKTTT